MKILLREVEIDDDVSGGGRTRIVALYPEDGISLCHIPFVSKPIWCANDDLSTEYNHAEGIYWNSWAEAREQLSEHEIITDKEVQV